ncbi:LamG-like jellyroll fold domain-containing protein [Okeania sp. SIO2C2]|uniref:LamG-like jellyroll fold domain-containing protein n=1 Tax=Okeania sp. SIO2C2 TaxID=2607787 RepID=UPI002580600E|nr:LamG-like jellyroll fold domain-containing protein [Okeania sp. SIO2C2]
MNYWPGNPSKLNFTNEISRVGFAIIPPTQMPTVAKESGEEVEAGTLTDDEIDPFLSTTARLTADAPFRVISDNQYIYLFRQSIAGDDPDMVFVDTGEHTASEQTQMAMGRKYMEPKAAFKKSRLRDFRRPFALSRKETPEAVSSFSQTLSDDELIPVVDKNLMVDRFVLTGAELKSKMEVRFKRSRHKSIPQSNKDSLGSQDMEGQYFYEPTQELDFVGQLYEGWFDALLLPTQISGIQRWQFFLYNSKTAEIDSFNVERDSDGLFNTKGTRYYTSPDPEYQDAVYERSPGTCPFTGKPLIPIPPSKSGYGEWALEFDGTDDNVTVPHSESIDFDQDEDFAIEAWIAVSGEAVDSDVITKWEGGSGPYPYAIRYSAGNGTLSAHRYDGTNNPGITSSQVINDGEYHHIAFVKNGSTLYLYIDGEEDGSTEDTTSTSTKNNLAIYFASHGTSSYFAGQIDEIRIWNRSLSQDEIQEDMNYRLVGNEPGLVGYWRFDEGTGNILQDQTDNGNHGTINGATWVQSQAPIGDSPGIRRTSFGFDGRTITSSPSAMLYYQQEQAEAGYDDEAKPIKSNARVILGVGTGGPGLDGEDTEEKYVAALDFALSREGKLAQIPDNIQLGEALESGTEEDLARLQELQQEVEELRRPGISLVYTTNELESLGYSVAIDGEWAIVGAWEATVNSQEGAGKAYIFHGDGSNWNLAQTLTPGDDAEKDGGFGFSVAIDGEWAIVGAVRATVNGKEGAGKAYIFHGDGSNWNLAQTLTPGDDAEKDGGFGSSVAIDGEWAIVGALGATVNSQEGAGKAYICHWDGNNWNLKKTLTAGDDARADAWFGCSVAIDGEWAIVGAVRATVNGKEGAGKAYICHWDGNNWNLKKTLTAGDDARADAWFGCSVAIKGEQAVAVAPNTLNDYNYYQVFVYQCQSSEWNLEQQLTNTYSLSSWLEEFLLGHISVAISDEYLLIGCCKAKCKDLKGAGRVDVYRLNSSSKWELETTLTAGDDIQQYACFGCSVAIDDAQFLIGSYGSNSAYYYLQGIPQELLDEIDELKQKVGNGVALPMHFLHTDPFGLTVSGALLGFAPSQDAPQFLDSTTGNLTLYFRGDQNQFFAAYYNTNTAKTEYKIATELATTNADQLTFVSRFAGEETNNTTITVADGDSADFCQVAIANDSTGITETWQRVPRKVKQFAAVFNGVANQQVFLDNLATAVSGTVTSLTLTEGAKYALKSGDVLLVNRTKVTVASDVERKATEVPINSITLSAEVNTAVYVIPYDYQTLATTNRVGDNLENGSLLFAVIPSSIRDDQVKNGTGTRSSKGISSCWVAEAPGDTLSFDGKNDYVALGDTSKLSQFDAKGDLTLETWVLPKTFDGVKQIIHHASDSSKYSLELKGQELNSAFKLDGRDDYVELPAASIPSGNEITISFWAYGGESLPKSSFIIYAQSHNGEPTDQNRVLGVHLPYQDGYIYFDCGNDGSMYDRISEQAQESEYKGTWSHWAFTKNATTGDMKIYLNGELWHSDGGKTKSLPASVKVQLGTGSNLYYDGQIDELRIWNRARTQTEIQADMNRRLGGNESGLVGYWHFDQREGNQVKNLTGNGYNGTIHGDPQNVPSPPNLGSCSVVAAVGDLLLESKDLLYCNNWHHVALVYNQSYGLQFDGKRDYLDCGNNTILNLQDMTVEVLLQVSRTSKCGILAKGTLNSGDLKQNVPYALYTENGKVIFIFEDENGASYQVETNSVLTTEKVYKIAVTRKKYTESVSTGSSAKDTFTGTAPDFSGISTWDDINTNSDDIEQAMQGDYVASEQRGQELANLQSPDSWTNPEFTPGSKISQWNEVKIYVDGVLEANQSLPPVNPGYNSDSLEIARVGESYLAGKIGEIRLWSVALGAGDIGKKLTGNEYGLVSWWRLEENEGNTAYDNKSSNHGILKGPEWIKNPDPNSSTIVLYHNGTPMVTNAIDSFSWGDNQFTLGACKSDGEMTKHFWGQLEELRIWKVARTIEQIQDNLFTRLKGEKQDLIAYYTFDEENPTEIKDHSFGGNNLPFGRDETKPYFIISNAPINQDTALVRSALAGVVTQFQETIASSPSIQEYGDMQYDVDGNMTGVMKRCHAYIKDNAWCLITSYKVGNLITEWLGQAQFDPQIIGYIEGAPPMPSENLTAGPIDPALYDYSSSDVSSVEVVEAESVNYNCSASMEVGADTAFESESKMETGFDMDINIAPFGFGTSFKLESKFGASGGSNFEISNGWTSDQRVGVGRNKTESTTVSLSGNWEDPLNPLNEALGRRYQPSNMGFALVLSETADIFALRLEHNNALVSFSFRPNPDIPRDVNLIPFPINPRYSKQGTLDGAIGYNEKGKVLDPDYASAQGYGEYSYFKPQEAYNLQDRIQREEQEIKSYYQNFDVNPMNNEAVQNASKMGTEFGKTLLGMLGPIGGIVGMTTPLGTVDSSDLSESFASSMDLPEKFAKRNIVNTYVWTADGGFYAESTEMTQMKQESVSGSFSSSRSSSTGVNTGLKINGFFTYKTAFNAMMGGSMNFTKTKNQESENSFSVEVTASPPGDLQKYDENLNRVYDENGDPVLVEGKVDAYRFMSFYLEPAKENFEDLFNKAIDPIWLNQSSHPNAVAMRQALQDNDAPPCWRVFHRVTFVSRLLPSFSEDAPPSLESTMKEENINSNWELIQILDPFVRNETDDFTTFSDAVHETLETYLPELLPYEDEITYYAALYYGVTDT